MMIFFDFMLVVGLLAVASNPSPYFAAFGMVVSAGAGCFILAGEGVSFLSLILFLVYLGGMMVVFAYSAALVAEPYPGAWGSPSVMVYIISYVVTLWMWWMTAYGGKGVEVVVEVEIYTGCWVGVSIMFSWGGGLLLAVGWSLMLTLLGVFEVVRGHYSGVLRAV